MIPSSLDPRPLWHIFIEHERHDCGEVLSKANEWNPGHVLHWRGRTGRPTMAGFGGCAFGSWINSYFLLHFSYFFFAVLFFCCLICLIEFDRQSLVEAQVFLTALRPGPVDIWVEARNSKKTRHQGELVTFLGVAPGRSRSLQARSSSQSQCLDSQSLRVGRCVFFSKRGDDSTQTIPCSSCWQMLEDES